jgi:hypothetical protein
VEFGPEGDDWRVRLVVPLEDDLPLEDDSSE